MADYPCELIEHTCSVRDWCGVYKVQEEMMVSYQITVSLSLTEAAINALWVPYHEAFLKVTLSSPCRQSLSSSEYWDLMHDDEVTKFVAYEEGAPVAVLLTTNNLTRIPWINPDYYTQRYPNKQVVYVLTVAADESRSGAGYQLVRKVFEHYSKGTVFCYDFSEVTNGLMIRFADRAGRGVASPSEVMDRQVYCAMTSG